MDPVTIAAIVEAVGEIVAAVWSLIKIFAVVGAFFALMEILFDPKGVEKVANFVGNVTRGSLKIVTPLLNDLEADLGPIVGAFAGALKTTGAGIKADIEEPLREFAGAAFDVLQGSLDGKTNIKPGQWSDIASTMLADATVFGLGSWAVTGAFESLFPEKLNSLNSLGPMLATLAGFEEVSKQAIGPLLTAGVGIPSRYDANSRFRSILPTATVAMALYARGIIDAATRDQLVSFGGIAPEHVASEQTGAYHGYSPRALLRVIESGLFTQDEIQDELTFSGMRPASQARMLKAAPYLATQPYRSELRNSLHAAFVAGLLSETELTDQVDAAESNLDRDNLILLRVRLDKRVAAIKELANAYQIQYLGHLIDLTTYQNLLAGLGLQADTENNLLAVAEAKANAAIERQLEAEERALERQTKADLRKVAIRNFKNGSIDAASLALQLEATGLSTVQTVAWTDLAALEQAGAARYLYGQLLDPTDFKLLSERVSAIETQYKKGLIPLISARQQLVDLKIDGHELAALLAKWAASVGATNKHGELLDVITGAPPVKAP